jgi:hypothetical protein
VYDLWWRVDFFTLHLYSRSDWVHSLAMNRDQLFVGTCPGFVSNSVDGVFAPIPSASAQMAVGVGHEFASDVPIAVDDTATGVIAPTMEEMCVALEMGCSVDLNDSKECFRVLFTQNGVILRDAIVSRRQALLERSVSRRSTLSSSDRTATPSTNDSSGSSAKKSKLCPPKVFRCPICSAMMNEKTFQRHVMAWVDNVGKHDIRSGDCPGIQVESHPLLARFPYGSLRDRVEACATNLKSLVHPGAYDALQPEGSGRHVIVAQRVAELMSPL